MATMSVRHSGFPGQDVLINAEDFDPALHQRIGEPEPAATDADAVPSTNEKPKKGKK